MRWRLDRKLLRLLDAPPALLGSRRARDLLPALLDRNGALTRVRGGCIRGWSLRVGRGHRGRDGVADEVAGGVRRDGGVEPRIAAELVKGVTGIGRERPTVSKR